MRKLVALLLILAAFCSVGTANAQVGVQLSPQPKVQFSDDDGNPLAGGKVCTYISGSNTPQATYTDFTGTSQNTNPVILDSAGRAQIWYDTTKDYRIVLRTPGTTTTCADGLVLWTVDGVQTSSLTMVGNLPPLFTSTVLGGQVTFTLSAAPAGKIFGNFTGGSAPPTFGAIGSNTQITFNDNGQMVGSPNLTYNKTTRTFALSDSGGLVLRMIAGTPGGQGTIIFGSASQPSITEVTDWQFASLNNQDISFGPQNGLHAFVISGGTGGTTGEEVGIVRLGEGAQPGALRLNDGNQAAGVFAGLKITAGFEANPNGVIAAATGSIFLTTAGGAGTTLWVKETSPTTTTGWVAK